jgi:hypothetical protein
MRMTLILALIGLLIVGYSFVGDWRIQAHWSAIVDVRGKANIADIGTLRERPEDVPKNAILMTFHHDWMVVRYIGVATFIVGIAGLLYGRRKPAA